MTTSARKGGIWNAIKKRRAKYERCDFAPNCAIFERYLSRLQEELSQE